MTPLSGRTRGAYRSVPPRPPPVLRTLEHQPPRAERLALAAMGVALFVFFTLALAEKNTISCEKFSGFAADERVEGAGVNLRCDVTRASILRTSTTAVIAYGVQQVTVSFTGSKHSRGEIALQSLGGEEERLLTDSNADLEGQQRVADALARFVTDRAQSSIRASFGSRARGLWAAVPFGSIFLALFIVSLRRARFTVDDAARTVRLDVVRPWPLPTTTRVLSLSEVRGFELGSSARSRYSYLVLTTQLGERIALPSMRFAGADHCYREIARVMAFLRANEPAAPLSFSAAALAYPANAAPQRLASIPVSDALSERDERDDRDVRDERDERQDRDDSSAEPNGPRRPKGKA